MPFVLALGDGAGGEAGADLRPDREGLQRRSEAVTGSSHPRRDHVKIKRQSSFRLSPSGRRSREKPSSSSAWLRYTRFHSTMKARRFVFSALLFALLVSLSGLRAFGSRTGVPSCHLPKQTSASTGSPAHTGGFARRAAAVVASHRGQAQRMHRNRGKRINNDSAHPPASDPAVLGRLALSGVAASRLSLSGPNPSRGPPVSILL